MECNTKALLEGAVAAVKAAGDHAYNNQHRRKEADEIKLNDVKLVLDRESQHHAEQAVLARYPDHAILGEEGRSEEKPEGWTWIIDPIDGTVNYFHGLDWWCSSVAVANGSEVQAGAIYLPAFNQLYTATIDGPALCNGEPISASQTPELAQAMISTGLSRSKDPGSPTIGMFNALVGNVQKIRLMGAAAIDLCHIAAGKIDAYYESSLFWWDVAAGELILKQAGGKSVWLEDFGDYRMRILATNQPLHEEFKEIYQKVAAQASQIDS